MRKTPSLSNRLRERGSILILSALSLVVLGGAVGLAVDSGRAYGVKARLNAAIDAAAIATARALSEGATDADRISRARSAGLRFFTMNYPNDFMGSTVSTPTINAQKLENGRWVVDVSATAEMPTTFMRLLGRTEFEVGASGQAIRRDLDAMLVMDTSGSLASPSSVFPTLKNAAINSFISRFVDGPGGDRVGLVSFASGAVIDVPINKNATRGFNRTQVVNAINSLTAVGATATAEGMAKGVAELQAIPVDVRSSLRVILLFSDGAPNMVNGQFWRGTASAANRLLPSSGTINLYSETGSGSITSPGRCLSSDGACRTMPSNLRNGPETFYSNDYASSSPNNPRISHLPLTGSGGVPLSSFDNRRTLTTATGATGFPYANNRCNVNKAARNMVERIANDARNSDIRVYTIGLGNALNTLEISFCSYTVSNESGASILRRVANAADSDALNVNQPRGLYCYAADASELNRCFSSIASEILRLTI
jgi:Flp pilus assembly protein TadG